MADTPYRVLICGDREWQDGDLIRRRLIEYKEKYDDLILIVGDCSGADTYARLAAEELGIPLIGNGPHGEYVADWQQHGPPAGPIRNKRMIDAGPNVVLAFHDNIDYSKGTKDCTRQAQKRGILVKVITHIEENI